MPQPPNQGDLEPRRWHWRECQLECPERYPTKEPVKPQIGQGWYDACTGCLVIWNGCEWVAVPAD